MKKILVVLLAGVMVLGLVACGNSAAQTTAAPAETTAAAQTTAAPAPAPADESGFVWNGQKEVWAILPTTGVPGLMQHADSMGLTMQNCGWTYVAKDAQGDPSAQVTLLEDAIAAGNVGAVMIAAMDTKMLEEACMMAKEAGIAVDMLGVAPEYQIAGFIATAYEITGMYTVETALDWADQRVKEGGNIPVVDGKYEVACDVYLDITDGIYRANAQIGTIEESGKATCVSITQAYGNSAQQDAYDNAQAVLAANPDCRIFVVYEPDEAMGAAAAIADYAEQTGLSLEDFGVFPCYKEDDTFKAMYAEVKADHKANAIKGWGSYGAEGTEEQTAAFHAAGYPEVEAWSPTGEKLAAILLGVCNEGGYTWKYGDAYYDDILCENVFGFTKLWKQGEANPAEKYRVDYFMYAN